jgi:hypothetical protein
MATDSPNLARHTRASYSLPVDSGVNEKLSTAIVHDVDCVGLSEVLL